MKSKPVVKYTTTKLMGTTLKYKETLLTTIKGPLAKTFIQSHNRGEELVWSYDLENRKIDIYRSELLGFVKDGNETETEAEPEHTPEDKI
jgi:hypothetical protein